MASTQSAHEGPHELPRSRLAVVVAAIGGLALLAALALTGPGVPRGGGPELAAPGGPAGANSGSGSGGDPVAIGNGVWLGRNVRHDRSQSLRAMAPQPVRALPADAENDRGGPTNGHVSAPDPVVQSVAAPASMPATGLNFDGIGFPGVSCNCAPPDTNGEVGTTQFVQSVNDGYQVFDKTTGASVYGPVGISTIWTGFGGVCETNGSGDPVVLFDQLAGRWLMSQFAGFGAVPTDECIAVSTSEDAAGSWYRYDFHLGSNFYDYPHLAVWPDGYYMSDNVFNAAGSSYLGPQPFVFDRTSMLAGQPATFQTTAPLGSSVDPILPADLEGSTLPPAGAPATFVRFPGAGTYQTYHYHVDWTTPLNSTFTTFASPAAAAFTALCPTSRSCVPELGVSSGNLLDGIGDRLMFRLTYRNFGDHESVVGNYTVSSGGVAGIRWFELRNVTSGPETVYQESTYQPDTTWRWMGSAAMDKNGDIAIGYSASSSAIAPQIRYAGRLSSDPLNTLGQGEATLFSGAGSQTGTSNRWGDYSDMTVDPVDGCTFWYTTEYYSSTIAFAWRTRIGTFSMPGCAPVTNDFSIAASPGSLSVAQSSTATGTISTSLVSGSAEAVILAATGLPSGVTPSFSVNPVSAGGSSTLTLSATGGATLGGPVAVTVTGSAASATHTTTVALTVTAPVTNPITNGGFETGDFSGWTRTGTSAIVTSPVHTGADAGRGGSTVATLGDSSLIQTFTVPASGGTLSFWYRVTCPDTVNYDWATVTLRDTTTSSTTTLLPRTCTNSGSWVQVSANLAAQAGHAVTLTLTSHDDSYAGDPTYTGWDDVVFQ